MANAIQPSPRARSPVDRAAYVKSIREVFDKRLEIQRLSGPMPKVPEEFVGVTVVTKANVYFEGNVVSHAVIMPDGNRKTVGIIFPGKYHFNTKAAELMQIVSGACKVNLDGTKEVITYTQGGEFNVPSESGFTIEVDRDLCEYICSFLS